MLAGSFVSQKKEKLCLETRTENELQWQCIVRTDFALLKEAGLCGKEINANEIMKHKPSEVKKLFSFWEE